MEFKQPALICPKCGKVIPPNGYEVGPDGKLIMGPDHRPIFHPKAALICETCAINAMPPPPKMPRFPRGSVVEGQGHFERVPMLKID